MTLRQRTTSRGGGADAVTAAMSSGHLGRRLKGLIALSERPPAVLCGRWRFDGRQVADMECVCGAGAEGEGGSS